MSKTHRTKGDFSNTEADGEDARETGIVTWSKCTNDDGCPPLQKQETGQICRRGVIGNPMKSESEKCCLTYTSVRVTMSECYWNAGSRRHSEEQNHDRPET